MNNLIFCLNATMPIFLMMVLGYFFNKIGVVSDEFAKSMNGFVFKIALPTLVFKELATTPFAEIWDGEFVAFCFVVTLLQIAIAFVISSFTGKKNKGEFIQASFRSSSALLGVGIAENLYGRAGMVPLMIIGAVPIYNITAVLVLMLFGGSDTGTGSNTNTNTNTNTNRNTNLNTNNNININTDTNTSADITDSSDTTDATDATDATVTTVTTDTTNTTTITTSIGNKNSQLVKKTMKGVLTNPIILGIVIGFAWSIFRLPMPAIFLKSCTYVANLATPLGLIALGAGLKMGTGAQDGKKKAIVIAVFLKLVGYCALFLPVAIALGYTKDRMIAVLIMLGSSTTVASFVMAKNMGHDGQVSAAVVFWTTLLAAFALTGWLYMLRVLGLI